MDSFQTSIPVKRPPPPPSISPMAVLSPSLLSRRRKWDDGIPPLLRPLVRAYLLGYASSVAPRLLTLLAQHIPRRTPKSTTHHARNGNGEPFLVSLQRILQGGLDWQRFPTFCAAIVGGSTLLEVSNSSTRRHTHHISHALSYTA